MKLTLSILLLFLICGCAASTYRSNSSVHPMSSEPSGPPGWFASFTIKQVQDLSSDECKAILIAKAAVEKNLSQPSNFEFIVRREGDRWSVMVSGIGYTIDQHGKVLEPVKTPGGFCDVLIDKDWHVVEIRGGA